MPYKKSRHRLDFENRIKGLVRECQRADRMKAEFSNIRDMAFQCAVFQTSAALETYLKLLIESWIFSLKTQNKWDKLSDLPRGFLLSVQLERHFARYAYDRDESQLIKNIQKQYTSWPIYDLQYPPPLHFDGSRFHTKSAYPSYKNIRRLFFRIGIPDIHIHLGKVLRADIETLIEGFQSIRTALAHSSPPAITLQDVKANLGEMERLVRGIDRVFYKHVTRFGGASCWS